MLINGETKQLEEMLMALLKALSPAYTLVSEPKRQWWFIASHNKSNIQNWWKFKLIDQNIAGDSNIVTSNP